MIDNEIMPASYIRLGARYLQMGNQLLGDPGDSDPEDVTPVDRILQIAFSSVFILIFFLMVGLSLCSRRINALNRSQHHTVHRRSKEERKAFVEKNLIVKHVVLEPSCEDAEDDTLNSEESSEGELPIVELSCTEQKRAPSRKKSDLVVPDIEDPQATCDSRTDPWICAICLLQYEIGDEICWSHNPKCNHVFHHECISSWLFKHDDCPMCRHKFLEANVCDETADQAPRQVRGSHREDLAEVADEESLESR